jgi:hypothetical protein
MADTASPAMFITLRCQRSCSVVQSSQGVSLTSTRAPAFVALAFLGFGFDG